MLKNTANGYGWISIVLHWLTAVAVIGLFALGLYMVDLTYYDEYYQTAPHIHKSVGILLAVAIALRLIWKIANPRVKPLENHAKWEVTLAHGVHMLLYLLMIGAMVSGYLISTADGNSIDVFSWFSVPSIVNGIDNLEDYAGDVHEIMVWSIIGLVVLHVAGGLKHWLIDKDKTVHRMIHPPK